jgi:hypothetical protein
MRDLLRNGYKSMKRPSGHDISENFSRDNGAAIPPNLIALANTESNSEYLRYCKKHGLKPHPARFPAGLPEFFVRMLTDADDLVYDPFGGSCVTGEVCERLQRNWVCSELSENYLKAAIGRFITPPAPVQSTIYPTLNPDHEDYHYKIFMPGLMWNGHHAEPLATDGGKNGRRKAKAK